MPQTENSNPTRPYDQLLGEPDRWYQRFNRFCELGPTRTIVQCYPQVVQERTPKNGTSAVDVDHAQPRKQQAH